MRPTPMNFDEQQIIFSVGEKKCILCMAVLRMVQCSKAI